MASKQSSAARRSVSSQRAAALHCLGPTAIAPVADQRRPISLVVLEDASAATEAHLSRDGLEQIVVVARSDDEGPLQLARRVMRRIAVLERAGECVGRAVINVGPHGDGVWRTARRLQAHAILTHMQRDAGSLAEIVLAADGAAPVELRQELMSLVGTLAAEQKRQSVPIRLRFGVAC